MSPIIAIVRFALADTGVGCRCARAWPSGHASVVSFHRGGTGLRAGAQEHRERRGEEREAVWKKEMKKINEEKKR